VPAGILFDVDGTLVDSNYLHVVAWWRAFREHGHGVPMAGIHRLIGMGSDKLMEALLGREVEEVSEAHSRHMKSFAAELTAFPAAGQLLRAVKRLGGVVVLATSAKPDDVGRLQEVIGAPDAVDLVASSGDVAETKPAPDIFAVALRRAGLEARRALAVGDSVWDVESAGRCGLGCVAVLTGGSDRDRLLAAGAVEVYESVEDLLQQFEASPLAACLRS